MRRTRDVDDEGAAVEEDTVRVGLGRAATGLLVLLALSACGSGTALAPPTIDPAVGQPYVDAPEACRSRLATVTTVTGRLADADRVVAATTCRSAGADGQQVVVRQVTGADLAALVAVLREPSEPARAVCDASGRALPGFALQLADGRWVHPTVPSDGCHPRLDAVHVLDRVAQ